MFEDHPGYNIGSLDTGLPSMLQNGVSMQGMMI
jgi:hypothetical protein